VANTDAVVRFPYEPGQTEITAAPVKVVDLPGGPLNHHWTKSLIASPDGSKLYVGVGSNSNVAENGIEKEQGRAAIWEIDPATGAHRIFASGLRNPVGMAWNPDTKALWAAVNERDELGSDLVPDYMTSVRDGAFYGWPYSYYGANVDKRVKPPRPDLVAEAIAPDYALGPHTASLGLAYAGDSTPAPFRQGMFVGQHGSWNRQPAQRLQGHLRAVPRRPARRPTRGRAHRVCARERRRDGPSGWSRGGQTRRAASRGRRGQQRLAGGGRAGHRGPRSLAQGSPRRTKGAHSAGRSCNVTGPAGVVTVTPPARSFRMRASCAARRAPARSPVRCHSV
jgi:glucose/arabinose dehydrogenase